MLAFIVINPGTTLFRTSTPNTHPVIAVAPINAAAIPAFSDIRRRAFIRVSLDSINGPGAKDQAPSTHRPNGPPLERDPTPHRPPNESVRSRAVEWHLDGRFRALSGHQAGAALPRLSAGERASAARRPTAGLPRGGASRTRTDDLLGAIRECDPAWEAPFSALESGLSPAGSRRGEAQIAANHRGLRPIWAPEAVPCPLISRPAAH